MNDICHMVLSVECVDLGRSFAVNLKNAGNMLKYLYHFLCVEDGTTTESFSVRVRLLRFSVF